MKKYVCKVCGYVYDEVVGDLESVPSGTMWRDVNEDWTCPHCGVGKEDFEEQ